MTQPPRPRSLADHRRRALPVWLIAWWLPVSALAQSFGFARPAAPEPPAQVRDFLDLSPGEMRQQLQDALHAAGAKGAGWGRVKLPIRFDNGSANVSPAIVAKLAQLAATLNDGSLSGARLLIEGHANATGSRELNVRLTRERAANVRAVLSGQYGVQADRLEAQGLGFDAPQPHWPATDGRQRRVELVVLPR